MTYKSYTTNALNVTLTSDPFSVCFDGIIQINIMGATGQLNEL